MKRLDQYWYSQNSTALLLLPLSWLFRFLAAVRRGLYRSKVFSSTRLPVPVIVVGNISVGGTGKTPLLIALCGLLTAAGYKPGVISRGYAAKAKTTSLVISTSTAAEVGDEPLLIARRTACPVAVGRQRSVAAQLLLQKHDCDIILSDDGLQHYALQRDLEIAVIDAARMHGNGYFLPAGPLRESPQRLAGVDLVVYNGKTEAEHRFELEFLPAVNLLSGTSAELKTFASQAVHAVAGIGNPQRFFSQLRAAGLEVIAHGFPDHYIYSVQDMNFNDDLPILMTEKDAVKCEPFKNSAIWAVPVTARLSPQLIATFNNHVKQLMVKAERVKK